MAKNSAVPERDPFIEAIAKRTVDLVLGALKPEFLRPAPPVAIAPDDPEQEGDDKETAVFDIAEFCRWSKISRSTLYQAWQAGVGPKSFKVGTSVRISRRAAQEWLAEREAASSGAER